MMQIAASERLSDSRADADIRDLAVCSLLVILSIFSTVQGRGIVPNSFMGRGIGQGLKTAFEGQQFPTCTRNATGGLLCDELTPMGPGDVTTVDGVFSFLHGGLAGLLWPPGENTTAAEALVASSLRVVGALKVRAQRVESVPFSFPNSFFEPIYTHLQSRVRQTPTWLHKYCAPRVHAECVRAISCADAMRRVSFWKLRCTQWDGVGVGLERQS